MIIKKIGHCCMVLDIGGKRILFDPGSLNASPEDEQNICAVIITHEHPDHFHIESLQKILAKNPEAIVVTNGAVGYYLTEAGIPFKMVEDSQTENVNGILIEGYGSVHALVYEKLPTVINTGYFIDNKFFFPGDAFYNPGKSVEVLALPVTGPWMKISEAVNYLKLLQPKHFFNVHDGMLKPGVFDGLYKRIFIPAGEEIGGLYTHLNDGESLEV